MYQHNPWSDADDTRRESPEEQAADVWRWAALPDHAAACRATLDWLLDPGLRLPGADHPGVPDAAAHPALTALADRGVFVLLARHGTDEEWRQTRSAVGVVGTAEDVAALRAFCRSRGLVAVPDPSDDDGAAVVPTLRFGDATSAPLGPPIDTMRRLTAALGPDVARDLRGRAACLLVVDPRWADGDRLWATLVEYCALAPSVPWAVERDVFGVDHRLMRSRRTLDRATARHLEAVLTEVNDQAIGTDPRMPTSFAVRFRAVPGHQGATLEEVSIVHRGRRTPAVVDDAVVGPMEIAWRQLCDLVGQVTRLDHGLSLVVLPSERVVAAWWPVTCLEHAGLAPVAWLWSSPHHGLLSGTGWTGSPGIARLGALCARWQVDPPTEIVDC